MAIQKQDLKPAGRLNAGFSGKTVFFKIGLLMGLNIFK
jgi:hypothetical protein